MAELKHNLRDYRIGVYKKDGRAHFVGPVIIQSITHAVLRVAGTEARGVAVTYTCNDGREYEEDELFSDLDAAY